MMVFSEKQSEVAEIDEAPAHYWLLGHFLLGTEKSNGVGQGERKGVWHEGPQRVY